MKLFKTKKFDNANFISDITKSDQFYKTTFKIIKVHECNMKIMTKIFSIIFYIKTEKFINIVSITKLKNIFNIFKTTGFDLVHEVIIYLLKTILVNRINNYHKLNPTKTLSINNSSSLKILGRKSLYNPEENSYDNNNSGHNTSYNSKNSNNQNLFNKNNPLNNNSNNLNNLRGKNNTLTNLNTYFSNTHNLNNYNNEPNDNENTVDYGFNYPNDRKIAEINGNLFSVEEFNDVLNIFTPALNMIKNKIYFTDANKNNKIFYKYINCLEVISFLVLRK